MNKDYYLQKENYHGVKIEFLMRKRERFKIQNDLDREGRRKRLFPFANKYAFDSFIDAIQA